jgi:signal transduction histidine kinase
MSTSQLDRARRGMEQGVVHGIGLARVHQFTDDSHGKVLIRSRSRAGTTIALVLPCARRPSIDEPGLSNVEAIH